VSKSVAVHKAISEALERWAFYALVDGDSCGFDLNKSTAGIAAWPGISKRGARRNALLEAVERWSLIEFWGANLATRQIEGLLPDRVFGIEIVHPFAGIHTVVLRAEGVKSAVAYGFGAGYSLPKAVASALKELDRNLRVLKRYSESNGASDAELNLSERRLLYFSNNVGANHFDKVAAASLTMIIPEASENIPSLIVDQELVGPWSKYARVWRCLFENRNVHWRSKDEDFFLF
jgi:hypothetical protein